MMAEKDHMEIAWEDYRGKIPSHVLGPQIIGPMRFAFFVGAAYSARFVLQGVDPETLAKQADTKADAEIDRNKDENRRSN